MELKEVLTRGMTLNNEIRTYILQDNYALWKKFIRQFNLNKRLKKSDLPAFVDIIKLIKENLLIRRTSLPYRLDPFTFYTDGGLFGGSNSTIEIFEGINHIEKHRIY